MKKFERLLHPLYLISLLLLIINDVYLKSEFNSIVTGKLSDFTGVFCLYIFLFELYRIWFNSKKSKLYSAVVVVMFFSAIQFLWVLSALNEFLVYIGISGLNLTPDKSDLVALIIIPFANIFIKNTTGFSSGVSINAKLKLKKAVVACSCFWFMATSFMSVKAVVVNEGFGLKKSPAFTLIEIEKFFKQEQFAIEYRYSDSDSSYSYSLDVEEKTLRKSGDYDFKHNYNLTVKFKKHQEKFSIDSILVTTRYPKLKQEYADSLVQYDFLIPFRKYGKENRLFD